MVMPLVFQVVVSRPAASFRRRFEAFSCSRLSESTLQTPFLHGLGRDGFKVEFDDRRKDPTLRAALPDEIDPPRQTMKFTSF
ncbi:MAG TPA: hypothetical protein VGC72_15010 [Candidatus Elarobacter sp.]|jgi:hypothetical protein